MYTRIQAKYKSIVTDKPCGLFAAMHHLRQKGILTENEDIAFAEIDSWFKANLIEPDFYKNGKEAKAITYFKTSSTTDMINRLQPLIQILLNHGVNVEIIEVETITGRLIYEDQFQIGVAEHL